YATATHTTITHDNQNDVAKSINKRANGLRANTGPLTTHIDDQYSLPASGAQPLRVATQWRLEGHGPHGPVEFTLISHHHLHDGRITAQWLAYDELALAHHGIIVPQPATTA
ncbi:MAG: hypothetical protein M3021_12330, partial [Actinomycetota bacterium]|nr:hypothetical protein [Actinomycetota bacterium]